MGFGLLLLGYTLMLDVGMTVNAQYGIGIDVFPDIIGFILIYLALKKLSPYSQGFKNAKYMCFPFMALSALFIVLPLIAFTGYGLAIISDILKYAYIIKDLFLLLFNMLLFSGIRELALEVDLPKIAKRTVIAFVIHLLYFAPKISLYIVQFSEAQKAFIILWYSIMWYILLFFILFLCFNCYMYICYEGEEDLEIKESKLLKFMNNLKHK